MAEDTSIVSCTDFHSKRAGHSRSFFASGIYFSISPGWQLHSLQLKPGGVRYMMKKLQERVHVDHIHPHKFRRTLATTLTRHDMPIQIVATILGHEKLDTTMQYVVLNKSDVKNAYERYA